MMGLKEDIDKARCFAGRVPWTKADHEGIKRVCGAAEKWAALEWFMSREELGDCEKCPLTEDICYMDCNSSVNINIQKILTVYRASQEGRE